MHGLKNIRILHLGGAWSPTLDSEAIQRPTSLLLPPKLPPNRGAQSLTIKNKKTTFILVFRVLSKIDCVSMVQAELAERV